MNHYECDRKWMKWNARSEWRERKRKKGNKLSLSSLRKVRRTWRVTKSEWKWKKMNTKSEWKWMKLKEKGEKEKQGKAEWKYMKVKAVETFHTFFHVCKRVNLLLLPAHQPMSTSHLYHLGMIMTKWFSWPKKLCVFHLGSCFKSGDASTIWSCFLPATDSVSWALTWTVHHGSKQVFTG